MKESRKSSLDVIQEISTSTQISLERKLFIVNWLIETHNSLLLLIASSPYESDKELESLVLEEQTELKKIQESLASSDPANNAIKND